MKQEARLKKWDELIRQKRYPGIQNFCALSGAERTVSDRTLESDIRELKRILASKYTSLESAQLLKYSRSRGGYYYPESISAFTEIDSRDIRNLQELSRSLSGFTHLFVTNEAKNAFYKLKAIAKLEEVLRGRMHSGILLSIQRKGRVTDKIFLMRSFIQLKIYVL